MKLCDRRLSTHHFVGLHHAVQPVRDSNARDVLAKLAPQRRLDHCIFLVICILRSVAAIN